MARSGTRAKGKAAEAAAATSGSAAEAAVKLKAAELRGRVRDADPVGRGRAMGAELAERAEDGAALLAARVKDAHLQERAAELAARARDSEAARRAAESARRSTDESLERLGTWLASSRAGERIHIQPAGTRRRWPTLLLTMLGVAAGFAAAKLLGGRDEPAPYDDPFVSSAERLVATPPVSGATVPEDVMAPPVMGATPTVEDLLEEPLEAPLDEPLAEPSGQAAPAAPETTGTSLVHEVRAHLGRDDRTADLSGLAINVAEGTVFVRGTVPSGFDESVVREVVASVPGVTDVDLQVSDPI